MSGTITFKMEVVINRAEYPEIEDAQKEIRRHLGDAIAFVSRGGLHNNLYDDETDKQVGQCDIFIDKGGS